MSDNKYQGHSDRHLIKEYTFFRPLTIDDAEGIRNMEDCDIEELLKITDELARRTNPGIRTETNAL